MIIVVIAFIVLTLALFAWVAWKLAHKRGFSYEQLNYIKAHWIRIIDSFHSHSVQGILDADKLLDYALKCYGFEGSLGEKLKKSGSKFSDLNGVWSAHKLRNTVAHELKTVSADDSKRALSQFKRALNDLGANL